MPSFDDASLNALPAPAVLALSGARRGTTHRLSTVEGDLVLAERPAASDSSGGGNAAKISAGFGHPLYPEGDVRALALLSSMSAQACALATPRERR